MTQKSKQHYPEWREYPSAVSEGVFFVATDSSNGPSGKARYVSSPTNCEEHERKSIIAKGDFVPDFDYASFSTVVFEELQDVLTTRLEADDFESGALLLRFVAFDRSEDWHIETAHEAVERVLANASFNNLDFDAEWQDEHNETTDASFDAMLESLEDADDETLESIRDELDDRSDKR